MRAFQRLRRVLGDELGIEPSPELIELEARMLRQEPFVDPVAPARRQCAASARCPTGTLTFFFTDLVTSTRLWEEHGAEMPDALRATTASCAPRSNARRSRREDDRRRNHRRVRGRVVRGARRLATRSRPSRPRPGARPVRSWRASALHTGSAESRDGDYFGPTLNRTARLMAIGHGGQVLLSRVDRTRSSATPPASSCSTSASTACAISRGPEHVFQVVVPGQPAEFPPLQSLDARSTNLPSS